MVAVQGSLLAIDPPPSEHGHFERIELAHGAWLEICGHWIKDADGLFERLVLGAAWHDEQRKMYDRMVDVPRRMCFYDEGEPLPDQRLLSAQRSLTHHYRHELGSELRTTGLCLYRSGKDSVAWHGDRIGRGAKSDVVIAIVSLGATRTMAVRPHGGGPSLRYALESGDLFVMGGSCQHFYEHCIPKTTRPVGIRVSVQYRPTGVR